MNQQVNRASEEDLGSIIRLLRQYDLPTQDIGDSDIEFYVVKKGRDLVACVGLEIIGDTALLRSLAIEKESAHQGIGTQLVKFILDESSVKQLKSIFLLTETAASFFTKLGFKTIERKSAPEAMQRSTEFSELCAETAVCMKIDL